MKIIVGLGAIMGVATLLWAYDYYGKKGGVNAQVEQIRDYNPKPVLNVGSGCDSGGDVNLDVVDRSYCVNNFVLGSGEDLSQFEEKEFSVAYAHHVLEHVEDPDKMLSEMDRVADNVIVTVPNPMFPNAYLNADHKWVFIDKNDLSRKRRLWS